MGERLDGTAALVTGASSGIGEATARLLAEHGAAVALLARRKDRLDQVAAAIDEKGGRALPIEVDVTDKAQAAAAVEQAARELGRLDTVVNNAGVMLLGPAEDAPFDEWERMVELNVMGVLHVAHPALPHPLSAIGSSPRGVADLVNISSVAGRVARAGSGVYNLTKWGLGAFTESLRQEFTRRHLRLSVIEPGGVRTELGSHVREEVREGMMQRFANVEMLEAADIADAVAYVVTRPRRVAVNEMLVRPTEQEF